MASRCAGPAPPGRRAGGTLRGREYARPLVAVRPHDRRVHGGMGVAPPTGIAVMSLWKRLAEVFGGRSAAERGEAEQLLLEADFGVAATAEMLERVAGA